MADTAHGGQPPAARGPHACRLALKLVDEALGPVCRTVIACLVDHGIQQVGDNGEIAETSQDALVVFPGPCRSPSRRTCGARMPLPRVFTATTLPAAPSSSMASWSAAAACPRPSCVPRCWCSSSTIT